MLFLDCDLEGENICFEVMDCVSKSISPKRVLRAKFSAVTEADISKAMNNLGVPNKNEAMAVDARQEIDLKVGVAFTRFQTRYFQGKYGNLDSRLISYGPCQTPTLGFCVDRHDEILAFVPEAFWFVQPTVRRRDAAAGSMSLTLDWARGRMFDHAIASMYVKIVSEAGSGQVTTITSKQDRTVRPQGLNTVEMLKAASKGLGMGPHQAMVVAERLYLQGYVTYPRTESTAYPSSFNFVEALRPHSRHRLWGAHVQGVLSGGKINPRGGTDAGDHPPITPMRVADEGELSGDAWRLYDLIARHFIASLSPDCTYTSVSLNADIGGETFTASGRTDVFPGFTAVLPHKSVSESPLPSLSKGDALSVISVREVQGETSAPDYLSESELIGMMEKNGIGTDASIATHVNNVCERNYVKLGAGRRMIPTQLGISLVHGRSLFRGSGDDTVCSVF